MKEAGAATKKLPLSEATPNRPTASAPPACPNPRGQYDHSANRSPDLASSSGAPSHGKAAMDETVRSVLRRPLHGFRESPGIPPGSCGARIPPQRRAFPRGCAGYSFVTTIIILRFYAVNGLADRSAIFFILLLTNRLYCIKYNL